MNIEILILIVCASIWFMLIYISIRILLKLDDIENILKEKNKTIWCDRCEDWFNKFHECFRQE